MSASADGDHRISGGRTVGAVVVSYHRSEDSERLIGQLIRGQGIAGERIVLVSNGDDPEVLEGVRTRLMAKGVMVETRPNPGYAAAVNSGVSQLTSVDSILVLTHDVSIGEGAVKILADHLESRPECGLVGPVLIDGRDRTRVWSAGGARSKFRRIPKHHRAGALMSDITDGFDRVDWLDGAVLLMRRDMWRSMGGLAEGYFLYMEDVDLGSRARAHGWEVHCLATASAEQSPGGGLSVYLAVRNMLYLLRAERNLIAASIWIIENVLRVMVAWLRPAGAEQRVRQRATGLRDGMRGGVPPTTHLSNEGTQWSTLS